MASNMMIDQAGVAEFAQQLVRTASVSGQEGAVAALLADKMRRVGFEVTVDEMGNVIGRLGGDGGKTLLYDGHMDTVDVGDSGAWRRDPFGGEIEAGVLYGRGAADMKGALAAMVYAGKSLVDAGVDLAGALYVAAVVQEEPCEGLAIRHVLQAEGLQPDWVVIGEPTGLQVSRGQRGRIEFRVTIRGSSCHASTPERGTNAIYGAARAIIGIELLAPELGADSFLGKGSVAVTEINSTASSRNAVPDRCTLYVDRRLTIGETEARALAEIKRILTREGIAATIEVTEYHGTTYTGFAASARQVFPYWVTPSNAPLLNTIVRAIEGTVGYVPRVGRWDFSTDGVYTAGVAGIPTVGFGPGDERYAHTVEDQVSLRDIERATRVYAALARRLLGGR
jgi:putative selenium metabolism hydrolase